MSLRVDFLVGAEADAQVAFNRLEEAREGLGVKFSEAVDRYRARIADFPHIAPVSLRSFRRQVMRWFPYGFSTNRIPPGLSLLPFLTCDKMSARSGVGSGC